MNNFDLIAGSLRTLATSAFYLIKRIFARSSADSTGSKDRTYISLGEPRLMLREDGSVRCDACKLCAISCPVRCIKIEGGNGRPKSFEIDVLVCMYCGACIEACPCDALRMDTGRMPAPSGDRSSFIYDMARLAANHPDGLCSLSRAL